MEESRRVQFDVSLGGAERLPHAANSLRFTAARSLEVAAMTESVLRPARTKLAFQTLPPHMRRRVMSHNAARVPRGLRPKHCDQLRKSGVPPARRRPSRKYRRRARRLLVEYTRRQRAHRWLPSHLWHAKRFRMTERWGCVLPEAPCDKAFRACYRASSAHCLLRDHSYLECVQISGNVAEIKRGFATISDNSRLGVCARAYLSGSREGTAHIYELNEYPYGYIGEINFMWKPSNQIDEKTLWVFVHPSFYTKFLDVLYQCFSLRKDSKTIENEEDFAVPVERSKPTEDELSSELIKVILLKDNLNRFSLTGPLSHAVLVRSLKLVDNLDTIKTNEWVAEHVNCGRELNLKEKWCYWDCLQNISSPGQLPPHMILAAVVKDPRLSRPPKRTKAETAGCVPVAADTLLTLPAYVSTSPLWDLGIHNKILEKKWTDWQLIKHTTEHQLIPGEIDENNPHVQSVPIILIQQPGSQDPKFKKLGYGSGWDIIMPAGYCLPFWRTFVMFGGRAGGLRETESLARESGRCYLPPDSEAGRAEEHRIYEEMKEKYFRLPPNKRVNYVKLGINSPFLCQWKILLNDWSSEICETFYVARDRKVLRHLQNSIERKCLSPDLETSIGCLVPVYIQIVGRGSLSRHAVICLPKSADSKQRNELFEPARADHNEKRRKEMRKENRANLKRLRRQRIKLKKNISHVSKIRPKTASTKLSEFMLQMRELWLPTSIKTVRRSSSREVMGYVSQGAFCFTEARSCGVAYVAYNGLISLVTSGQNTVLVRNTTSRKYLTATITILLSP